MSRVCMRLRTLVKFVPEAMEFYRDSHSTDASAQRLPMTTSLLLYMCWCTPRSRMTLSLSLLVYASHPLMRPVYEQPVVTRAIDNNRFVLNHPPARSTFAKGSLCASSFPLALTSYLFLSHPALDREYQLPTNFPICFLLFFRLFTIPL